MMDGRTLQPLMTKVCLSSHIHPLCLFQTLYRGPLSLSHGDGAGTKPTSSSDLEKYYWWPNLKWQKGCSSPSFIIKQDFRQQIGQIFTKRNFDRPQHVKGLMDLGTLAPHQIAHTRKYTAEVWLMSSSTRTLCVSILNNVMKNGLTFLFM